MREIAFWEARLCGRDAADHPWRREAEAVAATAETRRARAKFNTGSITITAAVALRALAEWAHADVVVEVGTFIGNSTLALRAVASRVYTCDFSNDCLEDIEGVRCFPRQTSVQMFTALAAEGVQADMCFFDGRLSAADVPALAAITTPRTVYVFDDYYGHEKGRCNVDLLGPTLPGYALIPPCGMAHPDTTLAVLVPETRL